MASEVILLYDGLCGFCDGVVRFVLRHDRRGRIRFAALQNEFAKGVLSRHLELAGVDSLILVECDQAGSERVYARSAGALRVCHHLGGGWRALGALIVVPRFLRDWAYDVFARWRYRVFGRLDRCAVPDPAERARFIDPAP